MDRPARVQVAKNELDSAATDRSLKLQEQQSPSAIFNTWYGKWAGGDKQHTRFRSPYRCNVERDSGYTKSQNPHFCIWFARGACYKGADCEALHRIPRQDDIRRINNKTDCFGRMKHANYREDMAGIGSLLKKNKTLFIGYFEKQSGPSSKLMKQLRDQFQEWGELERVKLGKNNSIAFVTYTSELNAQFAKEAMSNQSVTGKETLLVHWSRDDARSPQRKEADLQESFVKESIREIVKRVIQDRRNAENIAERNESKKRSAEGQSGLLSVEAARKLQELKKRKKESATNSNWTPVNTEQSLAPPQQQDLTEASETSDSKEPANKIKGGLVDYD